MIKKLGIILFFVVLTLSQDEVQQELTNLEGDGRILDESVKFIMEESINEETQDMKSFFKKINEEHEKDSDSIMITSTLNSDNSQTTGNMD